MRSGFITIVIIALLYIFVSSCGGSSGGDTSEDPQFDESLVTPEGNALSENELSANPILQVMADRDTYVTYLEPTTTSEELNLTGELGFDLFSYVYEIAVNHTVCWEDDDPGAAHVLTISNSTGAQVLRAEANGGCVTEFIAPGIYEARVDHDNLSQSTLPIFFVPQLSQVASTNDRVLNIVLNNLYVLISKLDPVYLSYAQTDTLDITTTIITNSCLGCSLEGILLRSQDLIGVNFDGSDLNGAILEAGDFSNANLANTSLESADIRGANFEGADLTGADLRFTEYDFCTTFIEADLTGALWGNGCECSNSTCSNCEEVPMGLELLEGNDCLIFGNPIVDDPGEGPIEAPIDDPMPDNPIAF